MTITQHNPMHPGEFIKRVYLSPFGIGSNALARSLHVSTGLISRLLNCKTDISSQMALKLSKVLGRSPESWLIMQDNFDLNEAKAKVDLNEYITLSFAS